MYAQRGLVDANLIFITFTVQNEEAGKKKALRGSQKEFFLSPDLRVSRDLNLSIADVFPGMKKILS